LHLEVSSLRFSLIEVYEPSIYWKGKKRRKRVRRKKEGGDYKRGQACQRKVTPAWSQAAPMHKSFTLEGY
jgi:hypothetical protein